MNGKDIFRGLQYIGDDLIENAETGQFPAQNQGSGKTRRPIRRPLLIAALIALLLLLVYPLGLSHLFSQLKKKAAAFFAGRKKTQKEG